MMKLRFCIYCNKPYRTPVKRSKVCEQCKTKRMEDRNEKMRGKKIKQISRRLFKNVAG